MKQIYLIIVIFFINIISKICSQPTPKNFISNIYYSIQDNQYYILLYIGDEQIPQKYFIDTTFPVISSPCNLCTNCSNHTFPFYIGENDIDFMDNCSKENQCINIVEHLLNKNKNIEFIFFNSKIFINDTINIKTNFNDTDELESMIFSADIGCTVQEGNFYKNKDVNGIIGLNNGEFTFIDELYNLNIIDKNILTILFTKEKEFKGYISFGDIINKDSKDMNDIKYINIFPSKDNLYQLTINYFTINNNTITKEYLSYIDTSSNFTFFPKNLYDEIINIFLLENKNIKADNDKGYCAIINKNEENNFCDKFSDILINFGDYNFIWKSQNYFAKYTYEENDDKIKLCFSFKEINNKDNNYNDDRIILGVNFLMEYEIIFDRSNQKVAFINSENAENDIIKDIENNSEQNSFENESYTEYNNYNEINLNSSAIDKDTKINDNENINNISDLITDINTFEQNDTGINIESQVYIYNTDNIYDNSEKLLTNTISDSLSINESDILDSDLITDIFINDSSTNILKDDSSDYFSDIQDDENNYTQIITDITDEIINYNTTENDELNSTFNDINIKSTQLHTEIYSTERIETNEPEIDSTEKMENIKLTTVNTESIDTTEHEIRVDTTESEIKMDKTEHEIKIDTTILTEKIQITEIITIENKEEIINLKENNNKETDINYEDNESDKNNTQLLNPEKPKNNFYEIVKSFLKNKLIYFLLAFVALVIIFVSIIFISCAFISCFKYINKKRKNYMQQVDIELPKYSKDNNIYSYTEGSN